jgi:hypothetical protein
MYGGGKGGGKSVLFCLWVDYWMEWLMSFFGLKPGSGKPPLPVGFIGRKQGIDFRKTTLETFQRMIPPDHYHIRSQEQEIIYHDCIKLYYGGLDDRQRINKFNSAEFAFFAIDQGEETERVDVDVLQASLRLKYNGKTPPYKQLFTANPADCWLKEDFIDNPLPGYHFIPALHKDNPHLPANYVKILTSAFRYNQALLKAYLDGDWHALQSANSLLSAAQFNALREVVHHPKDRRGVVVCDPSLGGDACVIKVMENYKTTEKKVLYVRKPMLVAGEMVALAKRHKIPNYAADTTGGLGEAILDRIREIDPRSERFYLSYSEKHDSFQHGVNLRAEMAWNYMMKVIDRVIPFPEDEETRQDVLAMRFKVVNSNGHILMEDKKETKKTLGRSPDNGDCEIMGVWALDQSDPIMQKDAWAEDLDTGEIGVGVDSVMTA